MVKSAVLQDKSSHSRHFCGFLNDTWQWIEHMMMISMGLSREMSHFLRCRVHSYRSLMMNVTATWCSVALVKEN